MSWAQTVTPDPTQESRLHRIAKNNCLDQCVTAFDDEDIRTPLGFAVECADRGGSLTLTTNDGGYVEGANVEDFHALYARSKMEGTHPRARCSVSVTSDHACKSWNEGIQTCLKD
jgi:hypothetical protein